jgi:hypothetical protein
MTRYLLDTGQASDYINRRNRYFGGDLDIDLADGPTRAAKVGGEPAIHSCCRFCEWPESQGRQRRA